MSKSNPVELALTFIETMVQRNKKYHKANSVLGDLNEFPSHVNLLDDHLHDPLMKLLDAALGEVGLASYYLYEQPHAKLTCQKDCTCGGKTWPLNKINQLRKYVQHLGTINEQD